MNPTLHSYWFAFGFVAYFVVLWLAVCLVLSFVSGWRRLHNSFPATEKSFGASLTSGRFRYIVGYRNVLWLGSNKEYLSITILFLFASAMNLF
jgi:hypothetical protein